MRWRSNLAMLGLAALVLAPSLGGCRSSGPSDEPGDGSLVAPTTTEPVSDSGPSSSSAPTGGSTEGPTSTTAASTDEAQIRQLIADWYEVRTRIALTNEYDDAELARFVGPELAQRVRDKVAERIATGTIARAPDPDPSRSEVLSVSVAGGGAMAEECAVDATVLAEKASGAVIDDDQVTHRLEHQLVRSGERWRIFRTAVGATYPGVQRCEP